MEKEELKNHALNICAAIRLAEAAGEDIVEVVYQGLELVYPQPEIKFLVNDEYQAELDNPMKTREEIINTTN